MRVIAGIAKGRRLATPARRVAKPLIRPTSDRAREAIFNILAQGVENACILDLFAGTGALALEALSRGAESAVFVDQQQAAIDLIYSNIKLCGFSEKSTVIKRDLLKSLFFLEKAKPDHGFGVVFLDPPYNKQIADKILAALGASAIVSGDGIVVAEENAGAQLEDYYGALHLVDQRRYGDTAFWMYRLET